MKHMKKLGLLAVSAMALMAFVGVSSASAAEFTTSEAGAPLKTETLEDHVFSVTGANVECETIEFNGETEGGATQKADPVYEDCTAAGLEADVNTAGCTYTFNAATDKDDMATVNLSGCTAGGIEIVVDTLFADCTIFVKNQSINSAVGYTDTSGTVDVAATATSVHAEVTKSTGFCPVDEGTHTNATYFGASEVSAVNATIGYKP